ncbi:hypothetical protein FNU76_18895 [Chitinimonas arctica]|uniref:Uncharacterized protein n=1 Tax=Chitinimonas arctica TaxID=2594795 RepID=A0A516SJB3_9NEIS|nr:hypothetical protein [Chitinimonas arctica]QDQ28249.1 hypothetical protein FNU76_18895 [Chitinimonas arctica]
MPTFGKLCIPRADTWEPLYTAQAGEQPTININMVNCSTNTVNVGLAIGVGGVVNGDRLEWKTPLDPEGMITNVLERSGIAISPGETVYVRASAVGVVDARAFGFPT